MKLLSRLTLLALIGALALSACGGDKTTKLEAEATGTPVAHDPRAWLAPMDFERELLEDYFKKREAAFEAGTDQGVAFLVDHNLAGLGADVAACKNRWFGQNPEEHVRETITPKWDTLRRDPTWSMPVGPRAGQPLGDDIFVLVVQQDLVGDRFLASSHQSKMHFQVFGNGVRNLVLCEPIKTIEVEQPGQDPILEDIPTVPVPDVPSYAPLPPVATPQFPQQQSGIPPLQQPIRPQAPTVLPPIQSSGRPIVRPTPNKPSQSPSASPTTPSQNPSPQPTSRPNTPAPSEPKPPSSPQPSPSAKPTAEQKPSSKPLPEAPDTSTGGGSGSDAGS